MILIIVIPCFFLWRQHCRNYTLQYTTPSSQAGMPDQLRVATYNVKLLNHGEDLDKFAKEIKALQPDILCLQEVDQNALRSGNMDMVKEIRFLESIEITQKQSICRILYFLGNKCNLFFSGFTLFKT